MYFKDDSVHKRNECRYLLWSLCKTLYNNYCGVFLKSMISVISRNKENPTFYPTIDQLCTFIISYLCILLNFCKEVGPFIINFCSKFLIVHESNVE